MRLRFLCLMPFSEVSLWAAFFSVFRQPVPDFDCPIALCRVALAPELAPFTALGAVDCLLGDIAALGFLILCSDSRHLLSHRAYVVVMLLVVIECFLAERIRSVMRAVLYMKAVVLDIGLDASLVHETVVLLRSVARVGHTCPGITAIAVAKRLKERYISINKDIKFFI